MEYIVTFWAGVFATTLAIATWFHFPDAAGFALIVELLALLIIGMMFYDL